MKNLRHSLMKSGLRDPADRPLLCSTRFSTAKAKTTHRFSELVMELEIINISWEFVAFFGFSQKKKVSIETLLEKC
jgi:hypothetical protein